MPIPQGLSHVALKPPCTEVSLPLDGSNWKMAETAPFSSQGFKWPLVQ